MYTIRYQVGTYSGVESVYADSESVAKARVMKRLFQYGLPNNGMCYMSLKVVDVDDEEGEDDGE
jgi:hypothetical protein